MSNDINRLEINFPTPVPADAFSAMGALCQIAGFCSITSDTDGNGRATWFACDYVQPVELPDGLLHALDLVTGIACEAWERENPTMVMWPAEYSCKPTAYDMGVPVEFDDDCYVIGCYAREDYHGRNPLNPDGPRLRAEAERDKPPSRKELRAAGEAEFASWGAQ